MNLTQDEMWARLPITELLAQQQGWAIFDVDGTPHIQSIDELDMIDDDQAIRLARQAGVLVGDDGRVLGLSTLVGVTLTGEGLLRRAVDYLIHRSACFEVEPLPEDEWGLRFKPEQEPGIRQLLGDVCNEAASGSGREDDCGPYRRCPPKRSTE